jgi:hypothetical protein
MKTNDTFRNAAIGAGEVTLWVIRVELLCRRDVRYCPESDRKSGHAVLFGPDARLLWLQALTCQLFPTLSG